MLKANYTSDCDFGYETLLKFAENVWHTFFLFIII